MNLITNKSKRNTQQLTPERKNSCFDSFDCAEHKKTENKKMNLILFSSQMLTKEKIESGKQSTGSSLNILTWKQLNASESCETVFPAVQNLYEEKYEIRKKDEYEMWTFEELHDNK